MPIGTVSTGLIYILDGKTEKREFLTDFYAEFCLLFINVISFICCYRINIKQPENILNKRHTIIKQIVLM
jgi:hypothetical protein